MSYNQIKELFNTIEANENNCLQIAIKTLPQKYLIYMIKFGADIQHRNKQGENFFDQLNKYLDEKNCIVDYYQELLHFVERVKILQWVIKKWNIQNDIQTCLIQFL